MQEGRECGEEGVERGEESVEDGDRIKKKREIICNTIGPHARRLEQRALLISSLKKRGERRKEEGRGRDGGVEGEGEAGEKKGRRRGRCLSYTIRKQRGHIGPTSGRQLDQFGEDKEEGKKEGTDGEEGGRGRR